MIPEIGKIYRHLWNGPGTKGSLYQVVSFKAITMVDNSKKLYVNYTPINLGGQLCLFCDENKIYSTRLEFWKNYKLLT